MQRHAEVLPETCDGTFDGIPDRCRAFHHQCSRMSSCLRELPIGPVQGSFTWKILHHFPQINGFILSLQERRQLTFQSLRMIKIIIVPLAQNISSRAIGAQIAQLSQRELLGSNHYSNISPSQAIDIFAKARANTNWFGVYNDD